MSGPLSVESRLSDFDLREKGNYLASVNISPFSVDQQNIRSVAISGLVQFSDWNRTWIFFCLGSGSFKSDFTLPGGSGKFFQFLFIRTGSE